ncbi:hypothetical protein [Rhizobium sp. LjRoot258]|uniref:hypothetical protein n=1 Tax=Rhizobium sp. LjRoot258 TaxID=3342299 RepID=UPI003ECF7D4F
MFEPPFKVATIATCYGGPKAGLQALARTRRAATAVEDGKAVAGQRGPGRTSKPGQDARRGHHGDLQRHAGKPKIGGRAAEP